MTRIFVALAIFLMIPVTVLAESEEDRMPTMKEVVPAALDSFWIVFLDRGVTPVNESTEDAERRQIEHLVFLRDLARKRLSVAAGPFDEQPEGDDGTLRGMIFLRGDLEKKDVEALLARDPHVSAGAMTTRIMKWYTAKGSLSWPDASPW